MFRAGCKKTLRRAEGLRWTIQAEVETCLAASSGESRFTFMVLRNNEFDDDSYRKDHEHKPTHTYGTHGDVVKIVTRFFVHMLSGISDVLHISYDLLTDDEAAAQARLSIFAIDVQQNALSHSIPNIQDKCKGGLRDNIEAGCRVGPGCATIGVYVRIIA